MSPETYANVKEGVSDPLSPNTSEFSLCFQCGACTAGCPWALVNPERNPVRSIIRKAQLGMNEEYEYLWPCTTCGMCDTLCPRGVPVSSLIRSLRYKGWLARSLPEGYSNVLWSIYWNGNPLQQPPSHRGKWAETLDLPKFNPEHHEVLYYVGCTVSYDSRAQKVAKALVRVLRAAGVSFGLLQDEPCCGEAALSLGHRPYYEDVVHAACDRFVREGVRKVITTSPHCYDAFLQRHEKSDADHDLSFFHYTQFLADLVRDKRLKFTKPLNFKVTYHDPCYLVRHHGEFDAPRRVLDAIPGVESIEMEHAGLDAICCGGGGGGMWQDTPPNERMANVRVAEALQTGAQVIATACPYCIICLEDGLKLKKRSDTRIMDLAEIVAEAL